MSRVGTEAFERIDGHGRRKAGERVEGRSRVGKATLGPSIHAAKEPAVESRETIGGSEAGRAVHAGDSSSLTTSRRTAAVGAVLSFALGK